MSRAHKILLAYAQKIIAVSEPVRERLLKDRIFPSHKIVVVPNGIRTELFEQKNRYKAAVSDQDSDQIAARARLRKRFPIARKFLVGTLGELSETKNQFDFVRAAIQIARARDDVNFVIGGADHSPVQNTRATLAATIDKAELKDRILLAGEIKDVPQFMCALDLFVSCSRSEAFGLVLVEAMAGGVAVVTTATDGAQEIIRDGSTGKLVARNDLNALVDGIKVLLNDERLRIDLGARARSEARARFDLSCMIERVEMIYEQA